jgi:transcriptional regulator with XRE-family HTH domain
MSMYRYDFPSSGFPFYLDRPGDIWRWMFADLIRGLRLARRLSIEQAARLGGMEFSEWEAMESGHPPIDSERLRPVAAVLEVDWAELSHLRRLP